MRPKEHAPELWKGLAKDDLQVVSTDHCPFNFDDQKELGQGDFRKVPNGLPGVEDRVDLMHDGGVVAGRMSRERWVEVIPQRPRGCSDWRVEGRRRAARMLTWSSTTPGADDDQRQTHHMDVDYPVYEGREVTGNAEIVLSRGKVIVDGDEWLGAAGDGRFLKRAPTGDVLARG